MSLIRQNNGKKSKKTPHRIWLSTWSAPAQRLIKKQKYNNRDKSENAGLTSVDRSTKATLSTYNTWIQVSRLQKIYHSQRRKLRFTATPLTVGADHLQEGRDLMLVKLHWGRWTTLLSQHGFRLRGVQS